MIRQETPNDYCEVYNLVKESFSTSQDSDGDEQDYLNDLRNTNNFIPQLSLVKENSDGKIIGIIVLYKMIIKSNDLNYTELVLSPICVHPDYFLQWIAREMIETALNIADNLWYKAVFLCWNPLIYSKLGFKPSFEYNIYHVNDSSRRANWCMWREIKKWALTDITWTIDIL